MNVKEAFSRIRKAVAVAVAGAAVILLGKAGVIADVDTVETLVTFAITSLGVYFVPNAKPYF